MRSKRLFGGTVLLAVAVIAAIVVPLQLGGSSTQAANPG